MMSYTPVKNSRNGYYSSDIDGAITKIQTGEISKAKALCKYGIPRQTLAGKCKNKRENVAEKSPVSLPVLGGSEEKYLVL